MVRAGDFHGTTGRRSTAEPSLQRGEPSTAAPSAAEMQLSGRRESPAPPNPSKRRASTAPPTAAELRASGHVTVAHSLRGKLVLPCADVATVGQLKAQVADRLGLDLDNLALFHRSKALRDDDDAVDAGMRFYAAYCSPASRGRGGRYYAYCSWCPGWTVRNPARLALISLIEQRWFDPLVLGLILLNVAFMCFTSPVADPTEASLMGYVTAATPVVELFFNIAFTIEMVLKLAAQGVVLVKFAYLRDGWNWLDALVVGGSWLSYGLENANYSIGFSLTPIRSVRVLRPLRTPEGCEGRGAPAAGRVARRAERLRRRVVQDAAPEDGAVRHRCRREARLLQQLHARLGRPDQVGRHVVEKLQHRPQQLAPRVEQPLVPGAGVRRQHLVVEARADPHDEGVPLWLDALLDEPAEPVSNLV